MFEGRIEGVFGIESPEDVLKLLDEKLISQEIKNKQQEAKLLQEKKKAASKQKEGTGSPREEAAIEGFDSSNLGGGDKQPGVELDTGNAPLPMTKTWLFCSSTTSHKFTKV